MTKKFQKLNHPEPDEDTGAFLYDVYEVVWAEDAENHRRYERVAVNLTSQQADQFVEKNGEWDD